MGSVAKLNRYRLKQSTNNLSWYRVRYVFQRNTFSGGYNFDGNSLVFGLLSYRDIEELLLESSIHVDHSTINYEAGEKIESITTIMAI